MMGPVCQFQPTRIGVNAFADDESLALGGAGLEPRGEDQAVLGIRPGA